MPVDPPRRRNRPMIRRAKAEALVHQATSKIGHLAEEIISGAAGSLLNRKRGF